MTRVRRLGLALAALACLAGDDYHPVPVRVVVSTARPACFGEACLPGAAVDVAHAVPLLREAGGRAWVDVDGLAASVATKDLVPVLTATWRSDGDPDPPSDAAGVTLAPGLVLRERVGPAGPFRVRQRGVCLEAAVPASAVGTSYVAEDAWYVRGGAGVVPGTVVWDAPAGGRPLAELGCDTGPEPAWWPAAGIDRGRVDGGRTWVVVATGNVRVAGWVDTPALLPGDRAERERFRSDPPIPADVHAFLRPAALLFDRPDGRLVGQARALPIEPAHAEVPGHAGWVRVTRSTPWGDVELVAPPAATEDPAASPVLALLADGASVRVRTIEGRCAVRRWERLRPWSGRLVDPEGAAEPWAVGVAPPGYRHEPGVRLAVGREGRTRVERGWLDGATLRLGTETWEVGAEGCPASTVIAPVEDLAAPRPALVVDAASGCELGTVRLSVSSDGARLAAEAVALDEVRLTVDGEPLHVDAATVARWPEAGGSVVGVTLAIPGLFGRAERLKVALTGRLVVDRRTWWPEAPRDVDVAGAWTLSRAAGDGCRYLPSP